MPAKTRNCIAHLFAGGRAGTRNTRHRDVVDEAGAALQYARQARVIGCWGGQANKVDAGSLRWGCQFGVVLRRQVDNDQAVDTCVLGLGHERFYAKTVNRVVVAHQHNRRGLVIDPKLANHLQGFRQGLACIQGTQGCQLDGNAVGHWVGEWHAQFDHIGAGSRQAFENCQGGVVARVARSDEGDQCSATLGFQFGEALFYTAHACFSWAAIWLITVCMSLSPRPDKQTTIR